MIEREPSSHERLKLLMACISANTSFSTTIKVLEPLQSIDVERQDLVEDKAREIYEAIKDCKNDRAVLRAMERFNSHQ